MWTFGLTTLDGTSIGWIVRAYERTLSLQLNGLPTAKVRLHLDDPLVDEIVSRDGDVLLKVYQDSTLRFVGELTTMEEQAAEGWYKRILSRETLLNQAYVLPVDPGFEAGTTDAAEIRTASDYTSIAARGLYQEVLPADYPDSQLRQALADSFVTVRSHAREIITFDPSAKPSGSQQKPSVMLNFSGPLWKLSKRLIGVPYPSATRYWQATPANEIIEAWITQTNTNGATGIVNGSSNDTLYPIDYGLEASPVFKPVSEGLTELQESKVAFPIEDPPTFVRSDTFGIPPHTAADLAGQNDDLGNAWAGAGTGSANDFDVEAGTSRIIRSAVSDANAISGRWIADGASISGAIELGVEWSTAYFTQPTQQYQGFFARYVDASNWLLIYNHISSKTIAIDKKVGGSQTTIASYTYPSGADYGFGSASYVFYQLIALIDDSGTVTVWQRGLGLELGAPKIIHRDADLATGGTLASGKAGIYDANATATASNRVYTTWFVSPYTGPQSFDFEVAPLDIGVGGETDLGELNIRDRIGTADPTAVFEYGAPQPSYGAYIVGDDVIGRAAINGEARFNGTFRVYGVEISLDENGRVREVPQLIPE